MAFLIASVWHLLAGYDVVGDASVREGGVVLDSAHKMLAKEYQYAVSKYTQHARDAGHSLCSQGVSLALQQL